MATLNISVPEELKAFIDEQVAGGKYGDSGELVTALLRRERAKEQLRALIQEGLDSPLDETTHEEFFASLRARVEARAAE